MESKSRYISETKESIISTLEDLLHGLKNGDTKVRSVVTSEILQIDNLVEREVNIRYIDDIKEPTNPKEETKNICDVYDYDEGAEEPAPF